MPQETLEERLARLRSASQSGGGVATATADPLEERLARLRASAGTPPAGDPRASARRSVGETIASSARTAYDVSPFGQAEKLLVRPATEFAKGLVGGFRQQLPEDIGSFAQTLGEVGGAEDDAVTRLGRTIEEFGASAGDRYAPRTGSMAEIGAPRDVPDYLAYQLGAGLASTAPSLVGGVAGATAGTAVAGPGGTIAGGLAGAAVPSYAQNVGSIRAELEQLGLADPEVRAKWALAIGVPVTMLDVLVPGKLAETFATRVMRTAIVKRLAERGILATTGKAFIKNAGQEALTEFIQEEFQYVAGHAVTDTPMSLKAAAIRGADAAVAGGLAGGVMGAGIDAIPQRGGTAPPSPLPAGGPAPAAPPLPPPVPTIAPQIASGAVEPAPVTAPVTEAEKHTARMVALDREEAGGAPAPVAPPLGEPEGGVEAFRQREAARPTATEIALRQGMKPSRAPAAAPAPAPETDSAEVQAMLAEVEQDLEATEPKTPARKNLLHVRANLRQQLRTLGIDPDAKPTSATPPSALPEPPSAVAEVAPDPLETKLAELKARVAKGERAAIAPEDVVEFENIGAGPQDAGDAGVLGAEEFKSLRRNLREFGGVMPKETLLDVARQVRATGRYLERLGQDEPISGKGYDVFDTAAAGGTLKTLKQMFVEQRHGTAAEFDAAIDTAIEGRPGAKTPAQESFTPSSAPTRAQDAAPSPPPSAEPEVKWTKAKMIPRRDGSFEAVPIEEPAPPPKKPPTPQAPAMPGMTPLGATPFDAKKRARQEEALRAEQAERDAEFPPEPEDTFDFDTDPDPDPDAAPTNLAPEPRPDIAPPPFRGESTPRDAAEKEKIVADAQASAAPDRMAKWAIANAHRSPRDFLVEYSQHAGRGFTEELLDAERWWNGMSAKDRYEMSQTLGVKSSRFYTLSEREHRAIREHFVRRFREQPVAPAPEIAQTEGGPAVEEVSDVGPVRDAVEGDASGAQPEGVSAPAGERPAGERGAREGRAGRDRVPEHAGRPEGAEPAAEGLPGAEPAREPADRAGRGDRSVRDGAPGRELAQAERDRLPVKSDPATRGTDYVPTEADLTAILTTGAKTKAQQNLAAIRVLRALQAEGRPATTEEQSTLARYTGWGQFPRVFDPEPKDWAAVQRELKGLVSDEEFAAMRASTLNAHYTSPKVVTAMWRLAERLGFTGGTALEPSAGAGYFIGLSPQLPIRWTATELDTITGAIAKHLYPRQHIEVRGFETLKAPAGSYDLAISNVPFGNFPIHDPRYPKLATEAIHNYFFARALDLVRPNGVVMFITSAFTLDARSRAAFRDYIAERAELVGAIRLPDTAFLKSSGTSVTTDILVFRKKAQGESAQVGERFRQVQDWTTPEHVAVQINEYFARHPEMMLGEMSKQGTMYGSESQTLTARPNSNIVVDLDRAIARFPMGVLKPAERTTEEVPVSDILAPLELKDGNLFVSDKGKILQSSEGRGVAVRVPEGHVERVKALIALRNQTREVLRTQVENQSDEVIDAARTRLHDGWKRFVKRYGPIGREQRTEIHRKDRDEPVIQVRYPNLTSFHTDVDHTLVSSIEVYDPEKDTAEPAAILLRRILEPPRAPVSVATPADALPVVLNELGRLDLPRIAQLSGVEAGAALKQLQDARLVFFNPANTDLEPRDYYLSGNVKRKLAEAKAARAAHPEWNKRFEHNVEELEKVQPKDLPPSKISATLGSPWIDTKDIEAFIRAILQPPHWATVKVSHIKLLGEWKIEADHTTQNIVGAHTTWGTERKPFIQLLELALNLRTPTVTDPGETKGSTVKNVGETLAAEEKMQAVKDRFAAWVWEDPARADRLARRYNDDFNTDVEYHPDGSHLTLHGAAKHLPGKPDFQLAAHQKDAVWRILQNGNTGLFHVVGAGKTFTMVAAAMEARRLGFARKPMMTVPNHMLKQFSDEFRQLYPNAKLLIATEEDFAKEKRKRFTARMASQDWDAVVMTHSSFEMVSVSPEFEEQFLEEQIAELEAAIMEAAAERNRTVVKDIEKAVKRLTERIAKLAAREKKDDLLSFEETGIDMVFVDEAHLFKNLWITSKMQGMGLPGSLQSFDLFLKTQYLDRINPGRGVVLATGTPIANAMAEAYTMQRYLQPRVLKERGIWNFDAWAATFGEPVTSLEVAVDGTYKVKTRFAKYKNVGELSTMFRRVADVRTAAMLNLPRPTLIGGTAKVVTVPASDGLAAFQESLVDRADAIRGKRVEPDEDNWLKLSTDGRKAALDLRLVHVPVGETEQLKVHVAAERIHERWRDSTPERGTQLVFVDFSAPGDKFNIYDALKALLIRKGIPAEQVKFIHDAASSAQKQKLFAAVNAGRVRVLIGSTAKLGAGTNVQQRLVELHHLDAPWRPADIEQRNGRILRQGNVLFDTKKIPGVRISVYVTEGSYDTFMWQTLERKAGFIEQFMQADASTREVEEAGAVEVDWATAKAIASGDPTIMQKAKVDTEVAKLERLRKQHGDSQFALRREAETAPARVKMRRDRVAMFTADAKAAEDTHADKFTLTVRGTPYTKRPEAGAELRKEVDSLLSAVAAAPDINHNGRNVGTFAGFRLEVEPAISYNTGRMALTFAELTLVGEGRYSIRVESTDSPQSIVASLEALPRRIPGLLLEEQDALASAERAETDLKGQVGTPFPHEAKLAELKAEQAALNARLQQIGQEKEERRKQEGRLTGTPMNVPERTAEFYATRIRSNAESYASDAITREEFHDLQREAWDEIEARGEAFADEVKKLVSPKIGGGPRDVGGMTTYSFLDPVSAAVAMGVKVTKAYRARKAAQRDAEQRTIVPFANPDVEKRWRDAKGLPVPSLRQRAATAIAELRESGRHFPLVDVRNNPVAAAAYELLLGVERAPAWSQAQAYAKLADVTQGLVANELDLFTRALILPDVQKDVEAGLYSDGRELPFGLKDHAEVEAELKKVEAEVATRPNVRAALDRRADFAQDLTLALVEMDLLDAKVLEDDRYFHRQVLAHYEVLEAAFMGTGTRDVRTHKKGFQKRRSGGSDFNTAYHEAEFEWVAQAYAQIKMRQTLMAMQRLADIRPRLRDEAEQLGKDPADIEIPDGYREWQPEKGNFFFRAITIQERVLDELLSGQLEVSDLTTRMVLAMGRKKPAWVIPDWLARTMDRFAYERPQHKIERLWMSGQAAWKQWTLLSPARWARYNLNNISGDLDASILYPGILRYARGAYADIYRFMIAPNLAGKHAPPSAALKQEILDGIELGVVNNTMSIAEIPDVANLPQFEGMMTRADSRGFVVRAIRALGIGGYWKWAVLLNQWRENMLRLAAWRYFRARLAAAPGVALYGVSNRERVDAETDLDKKAALLARDLIGDYGDISAGGMWARTRLFPFFSWVEINAKRYTRLARNIKHEANAPSYGRLGAAVAARTGLRAAEAVLLANAFFLLVNLWNRLLFPDEEEELRTQNRNLHLILGRNDDGSVRWVRVEGAFSDFLEWINLQDYPSDIVDLAKGKETVGTKLEDAAMGPVNKVVGMWEPWSKTIFEMGTQRTLFPDVREPRPIRDRGEYVARLLSVDMLYKAVTGKPTRPGGWMEKLVLYQTDPGEAAYFGIRERMGDFLEKQGQERTFGSPTERDNALYYWRKAVQWGDTAASERWLKRYTELGGTPRLARESIARARPLEVMPKRFRGAFIESLTPAERDMWQQAEEWWARTYVEPSRESLSNAPPRPAPVPAIR